ncbi:MAG: hypothetical protein LBV80_03770 [Deltaproteobacteria bacterium]|jgi:hypothetical protein|nr:hypothetical protein [Deltaproteobacteria bacterium]
MLDIHSLLDNMKRPAFASEDDFKFVFAYELQKLLPDANVVLEYPHEIIAGKRSYIDIAIRRKKQYIPIELKYKTKQANVLLREGEPFKLKNHSACDIGRYDFLRDIWRLEQLLKESHKFGPCGYAVLLTNDRMYWDKNSEQKINSNDRDFKFFDGDDTVIRKGIHSWYKNNEIAQYSGSRYRSLEFDNQYDIRWHDYFPSAANPSEPFRYVTVTVPVMSHNSRQ